MKYKNNSFDLKFLKQIRNPTTNRQQNYNKKYTTLKIYSELAHMMFTHTLTTKMYYFIGNPYRYFCITNPTTIFIYEI